MIDALQRAHARMLATLPVHTHRRMSPEERTKRSGDTRTRTKQASITVKNGLPRPVILDGKRYPSLKEAARKLRVTDTCVAKRILRGRGAYL